MKKLALAALLSLFALPAFALPSEATTTTWYDSNGNQVGSTLVRCTSPVLTITGTTGTAYYTTEILYSCDPWEPESTCADHGLETTNCYNYCASSDYVALVLNDVVEDECID